MICRNETWTNSHRSGKCVRKFGYGVNQNPPQVYLWVTDKQNDFLAKMLTLPSKHSITTLRRKEHFALRFKEDLTWKLSLRSLVRQSVCISYIPNAWKRHHFVSDLSWFWKYIVLFWSDIRLRLVFECWAGWTSQAWRHFCLRIEKNRRIWLKSNEKETIS